jgi:hypothetical protein
MDFSDILGEHLKAELEAKKVFERLHSLLQAGYKIDLSRDFVDAGPTAELVGPITRQARALKSTFSLICPWQPVRRSMTFRKCYF